MSETKINTGFRLAHTMIRVRDLELSLTFYCDILGMQVLRRKDYPEGKFTNTFIGYGPEIEFPTLELTYNWDHEKYTGGRNFGHLAYSVPNIYDTCQKLIDSSVTINRPPRDGRMAFIRSPDSISIELLQDGEALPIMEPWSSMKNIGSW